MLIEVLNHPLVEQSTREELRIALRAATLGITELRLTESDVTICFVGDPSDRDKGTGQRTVIRVTGLLPHHDRLLALAEALAVKAAFYVRPVEVFIYPIDSRVGARALHL